VFIGDDHEALVCRIVAFDAGIVGAAEPVVCGVKERLEHHGVQHTREVPLGIPV
jgi:hypothetical protein